ncbi:four-helix bundle copper-binding protein [Croceicoccus ponticola]|uniref:Four-helix bundle copper-binding protein n=1 Tax=Croceicoccus ponticola TaxID=2217664 RepID=A0A437GVP8_9SPHN|nr:four-helix bundle copper-binding protein [Croceicoccus ponticola]RVQ65955.1 four-helix bundle copper-binding protein [Croceicoccus ponticola]
MSIEKMISEHPAVGDDYNQSLGLAVKHTLYCAAICNSCADACSAEEMDMSRCIRLCSDASDICTATYRVASRRTDENRAVIRAMLAVCVKACEACADECEKHDNAHCKRCAQMCRECARDCKAAMETLHDEAVAA